MSRADDDAHSRQASESAPYLEARADLKHANAALRRLEPGMHVQPASTLLLLSYLVAVVAASCSCQLPTRFLPLGAAPAARCAPNRSPPLPPCFSTNHQARAVAKAITFSHPSVAASRPLCLSAFFGPSRQTLPGKHRDANQDGRGASARHGFPFSACVCRQIVNRQCQEQSTSARSRHHLLRPSPHQALADAARHASPSWQEQPPAKSRGP